MIETFLNNFYLYLYTISCSFFYSGPAAVLIVIFKFSEKVSFAYIPVTFSKFRGALRKTDLSTKVAVVSTVNIPDPLEQFEV
jgi:hypothetical protein